MCHLMPQWHLPKWQEEDQVFVHRGSLGLNHVVTSNRVCHRACQCVICHFHSIPLPNNFGPWHFDGNTSSDMTHYVVQFRDGGGHTMGCEHHHILCNLKMMLLPGNCMSSTILKLDQIVCCGQIVRWLKWWIKTGEMSNTRSKSVKGWGLGTLFVLVSPCFMKNVVFTCKIGSFLCSLDNLLQKNVIVFFFGNQISKWCSFEKGLFLTCFSHF